MPRLPVASLILLCSACAPSPRPGRALGGDTLGLEQPRLPTGERLDPAGTQYDLRAAMPLTMLLAPDGRSLVVSSAGYRAPGLDVVERRSGAVTQSLPQPAAFLGLAFAPDGNTLFASGADEDVVYRYTWAGARATLADSIVLAPKAPDSSGTRYPAGLAVSPDGARLYVAENVADSLALIDVAGGRVLRRLSTGHLPYAVAASPDGRIYVSNWGEETVSVFRDSAGTLYDRGRIEVGRHPSALLLNRDGSRLFVTCASTDRVAVVDTRRRHVVTELLDPPPAGPAEGSTPNALALSADGTRLFVAEADANAVAVFDLLPETSNVPTARGNDQLAGRIPVGWYPTAVVVSGDTLLVGNGKGRGTVANPGGPQPRVPRERRATAEAQYTLSLLRGSLTVTNVPATAEALAAMTTRVTRANGWDRADAAYRYPPIEHVLYIIKENRTYDQVLGDERQGDGDTTLVFFGRETTPNIHALADRFGLYDRFFVNAEVSAQGHDWSTAAYVTDYREKTTPPAYANKREARDESDEGEDAAEPANGFLWNLAQRAGISYRNYGEYLEPDSALAGHYTTGKAYLASHSHPTFPSFDMKIPDQQRADLWLEEFAGYVRDRNLPALETIWLPRDHTAGGRPGFNTPRAMAADNDLAVGRIVEAVSRSPYWRSTVIFVLEDDAQSGPDHVDSHRSPLLVISPWARGGAIHRFANTTDVLKTIEELLHLGSLSQFDHYGRALRDVWRDQPDLAPYAVVPSTIDLAEINPDTGKQAQASSGFRLDVADAIDDEAFNRVLWSIEKGAHAPYPAPRQADALTLGLGSR